MGAVLFGLGLVGAGAGFVAFAIGRVAGYRMQWYPMAAWLIAAGVTLVAVSARMVR